MQVLSTLFTLKHGGISEDISTHAKLSVLSVRPELTELQEMNLIYDSQTIVWKIKEEGKNVH